MGGDAWGSDRSYKSSSHENWGLQVVAVHLGIAKPQIVVSTLAIIPLYVCYERTDCRASSPYLIVAIASVDLMVKAYRSCAVPSSEPLISQIYPYRRQGYHILALRPPNEIKF
jgi:hypothetical protein